MRHKEGAFNAELMIGYVDKGLVPSSNNVNLREGLGTDYAVIGSISSSSGDKLAICVQDRGGYQWIKL